MITEWTSDYSSEVTLSREIDPFGEIHSTAMEIRREEIAEWVIVE